MQMRVCVWVWLRITNALVPAHRLCMCVHHRRALLHATAPLGLHACVWVGAGAGGHNVVGARTQRLHSHAWRQRQLVTAQRGAFSRRHATTARGGADRATVPCAAETGVSG